MFWLPYDGATHNRNKIIKQMNSIFTEKEYLHFFFSFVIWVDPPKTQLDSILLSADWTIVRLQYTAALYVFVT